MQSPGPFVTALPGLWILDLWPLGSLGKTFLTDLHVDSHRFLGIQRDNDVTFTTPAFDFHAFGDDARQQVAATATQRVFRIEQRSVLTVLML
jgi:hypothetical protein